MCDICPSQLLPGAVLILLRARAWWPRPGLSRLVPCPPLGSVWCSWGFWMWLMFLLCFLTSKHLKEWEGCTAADCRGTFIAWRWGYLKLLRPCRSRCWRVPVWEKAGGWCGEKEAKWGEDCPYHLLGLSQDKPFSTLHLGLCQREPAVLSPEDLEMSWCFSKVDAHGLGFTGGSELACRLDEGMTGQPEEHHISLILSYVSVILSHHQRATSRRLPRNGTVTPILIDLGMSERPAFGWSPEAILLSSKCSVSARNAVKGEILFLPIPGWPSCCSPGIP